MFGNLVNSSQVKELIANKDIGIKPFDESKLKTVHYPLTTSRILRFNRDKSLYYAHTFDGNGGNEFTFDENEYVVIEIKEHLDVCQGIVGQFIPASTLIEGGISITAGRLEWPFGQNGEIIRFGLKNVLNMPNVLRDSDVVAYVQYFDLRGLRNKELEVDKRLLEILERRLAYARDHGPRYDEEN